MYNSVKIYLLVLLYFLGPIEDDKQFVCNGCGKIYKHYASLWKHRTYVCGKAATFQCVFDGCNYMAKRKDNLKSHIKCYHNVKLEKNKLT